MHETEALRIAIDRVPDAGLALELRLGADWLAPLLGAQFSLVSEGLDIALRADLLGEHLEARGDFAVRLGFSCSRCGEPQEVEVREPWRVIFVSPEDTEDEEGTDAASGDGGDIVVGALRDGIADLNGPLGEAIVLALPAYPLCREDCRGLCAGCGTNLNEGTCRCKEEKGDSRWAKLAELRDKMAGPTD